MYCEGCVYGTNVSFEESKIWGVINKVIKHIPQLSSNRYQTATYSMYYKDNSTTNNLSIFLRSVILVYFF